MGLKRIYVAHPLRGLDQAEGTEVASNFDKVSEICRQITDANTGFLNVVPFSPIHTFCYLDPVRFDNDRAIDFCKSLLASCDEIWVFGPWWESEGAQIEMEYAVENNIPVKVWQNAPIKTAQEGIDYLCITGKEALHAMFAKT